MDENITRSTYVLELIYNSAGDFVGKWNVPTSLWMAGDEIRLYENASKKIDEFMEKKSAASANGVVTFSELVNVGTVLRYIQGINELYQTAPFPNIILGMSNEIYYPNASANIISMQLSYKNGHIVIKEKVENAKDGDFIGIYDSLLADYHDHVFKVEKNLFVIELMTSLPVSKPYYARYITSDESSELQMVRRTFQMINKISVHEQLDRALSDDQKYQVLRHYPKIELDCVRQTDEDTNAYNCIAWSLGLDDRWINPLGSIDSMVEYYKMYGCQETTTMQEQKVDLWASADAKPTHGSKFHKKEGSEAIWESKLGSDIRMTHNRQGVENGTYGIIVRSFTFPQFLRQKRYEKREWSCRELHTIDEEIRKIPSTFLLAFEKKFSNWYEIWFKDETKYSSNTNDLKLCKEYQALYELGVPIIPLILKKLCDENYFPALVLYDDLQLQTHLKLDVECEFDSWIMGEQERAEKTILRWIENQA